MIEVRWHGRGGQGAFTAAKILGAAIVGSEKKYALSFPSFGPERRGAPVSAFTKIDTVPVHDRSESKRCDYIVFLDDSLYTDKILNDLKEGGTVLVNTGNPSKYQDHPEIITIGASSLAKEVLGVEITNTAMLGALLGVSDFCTLEGVELMIPDYLNEKVVDKNISVINQAYKAVREGLQ